MDQFPAAKKPGYDPIRPVEVQIVPHPTTDVGVGGPKLVNLTGHDVVMFVPNTEGVVVVPYMGDAARVNLRTSVTNPRSMIPYRGVQIPFNTLGVFETTGLPKSQPNTMFIVSFPVARENLDRDDLLIVTGKIRDERGRVLGATNLSRLKVHSKGV